MTGFEKIYREHFGTVYKYLLHLCRNASLADELAQETFFRAMRSLDKFDGRCQVDVWLCQIAKNAFYSYYRKHKNTENVLPEIDSGLSVEGAVLDHEQAMAIYEKLHDLNEPYMEVFMLRLFGGLEYAQIAKLFQKTEGWARVIYHRAKMTLTKSIEKEEETT